MGNKVTKPQLIIGGVVVVTIGGFIYQKKQNEKRSNELKSSQQIEAIENEGKTIIQNPSQVVVQSQQDVIPTPPQITNNIQIKEEEDPSSIYGVNFINKVNKELKAYQEQRIPLSFEVLIKITEAGFKQATKPYSQNQQRNRIERRKVINSPQQYVNCVLEFNNQLEALINEKQLDICSKLRISSEIYENSFMMQFENEAAIQQLIFFQLSQRQQLIASIPSQKDISESDLAQVINLQLKKLDDVTFFQKYLQTLQGEDQQLGSIVITILLSDIVYNQFGFEEEDILKAILAYPMLKNQLAQIQQKVQIVFENCLQ
ncbi:unnamed protein product [Paramecium sonneborni]|uniref:Transmembrane protein n=1 Tax=Paramecium sonneborni TaxID=65129 RepID=A0A8S1LLI7_9CILI|nr:unnamed protein product [Paramecium sonneborni]